MKTYSFTEYSVLYTQSLRLVDLLNLLPLLLVLLLMMMQVSWILEWLLIFGLYLTVYKVISKACRFIVAWLSSNRGLYGCVVQIKPKEYQQVLCDGYNRVGV